MTNIQILLYPLSLLYGLITCIRNQMYDRGFVQSHKIDLPVICVGNLCSGGTGKTPHVEYLVQLFKDKYSLAVLSRGYKRKTHGFLLVDIESSSEKVGDEPKQYKQKFNDILVAVVERRYDGFVKLKEQAPHLELVLLDDAFQHRAIQSGLTILLTDYHKIYMHDHLLPSGTLRETKAGAKRAEIIIVTKTPRVFSPITRKTLMKEINPLPHQKVYFSYIEHGNFVQLPNTIFNTKINKIFTILMFTGIVNTYPLEEHLKRMCVDLEIIIFSDHYQYTEDDMNKIKETFNNIIGRNKIIVTTEKDAMRLENPKLLEPIKNLPVFYVPIKIKFHKEDEELFNNQLMDYVRKNQTNHQLHSE